MRAALILVLVFLVNFAFAADRSDSKVNVTDLEQLKACANLLRADALAKSGYRFGTLQQFESGLFGDDVAARRSSLLGFYGNWIRKFSRLPTVAEFGQYLNYVADKTEREPDAKPVFGRNGVFANLAELLNVMRAVYPEFLAEIEKKLHRQTVLFIRHRMRPPTVREIAEIIQINDLELVAALTSDENEFWREVLNSDIGRHVDYARKRIKTAYARAVRGTDTALVHRTRKVAPTLRRLVEVMILTKSNEHYQWRARLGDYGKFALEDVLGDLKNSEYEKMMGQLEHELAMAIGLEEARGHGNVNPADNWIFRMPKLFPGGMKELHEAAVREYQPTFTSFEDTERFGLKRAEVLKDKITDAPGFLVAEITPGLKVNWELLDGMIKYSKLKNYPIVLIPSKGMFQNLDPEIVNHPDLNILTATIENRELSLRLFPNNGRKDAFSLVKEQGMYEIGQQIIVPHHTMGMEVIPTGQNHLYQTKIYATGTVSLPEMAAIGSAGKIRAEVITKAMKPGFTAFSKIDRGDDLDFGGVGNHWHGRPVEFRFAENDQPAVFVDANLAFKIRKGARGTKNVVEVEKTRVVQFVLPDVHFLVANPHIMKALKELFDSYAAEGIQVVLVLPDPVDSKSINAHVEKKQKNRDALHSMYKSGELSFESELNETIGNVNVLLAEFPYVTVVFQYSNHSDEWIQRNLMNDPSDLQQVVNGKLISEIRTACNYNGWTPLEYLLLHRKTMLERLVVDKSDAHMANAVFISDPTRVRTMRHDEPLASSDMNPDYRTFLHHHGHKGANGGKSSFKTHTRGEKRLITGDAHRPGYMGRGNNMWIGVGATAYQQDYSAGGYSSWGTPIASISQYGTMGLFDYDPYSKSYIQRPKVGPLPPADFFGADPLRVVGPKDDDQRRREIDSEEFRKWFKGESRWIPENQRSEPD